MKRAIQYSRISTEEQSNWSITGQIDENNAFATRKGWIMMKTFVDEGQSAKSFDRADWKELEAFVKRYHSEIDYLIVCKYDRFSRDLREALQKIHEIEDKYKIKIVSAREDIGIPPESPFYFKWRIDLLTNAQFERLVIIERTTFGIRSGKKAGRFLNSAPFGYKNERDAQKQPIITIVEEEAEVIRYIFRAFLDLRITYSEIKRQVLSRFKVNFYKERIVRILSNPTYAGMIYIKAYGEYPESIVPGLHEPIISETDYYRAKALIDRPKLPRREYNDIAYLKSAICCPDCYKPLTCSKSKGKSKYYWYYECTKHRKSHRIELAHDLLNQILSTLSFDSMHLSYLKQSIQHSLLSYLNDKTSSIAPLQKKLEEINKKIERLNAKYLIDEAIDSKTYSEFLSKFKIEKLDLEDKINGMSQDKSAYWENYNETIDKLGDLRHIFGKAGVHLKQRFIELVFGKDFVFTGSSYRTHNLNILFKHKALILKEKGLLLVKQSSINFDSESLGEANVASIEPLLALIKEIA